MFELCIKVCTDDLNRRIPGQRHETPRQRIARVLRQQAKLISEGVDGYGMVNPIVLNGEHIGSWTLNLGPEGE